MRLLHASLALLSLALLAGPAAAAATRKLLQTTLSGERRAREGCAWRAVVMPPAGVPPENACSEPSAPPRCPLQAAPSSCPPTSRASPPRGEAGPAAAAPAAAGRPPQRTGAAQGLNSA